MNLYELRCLNKRQNDRKILRHKYMKTGRKKNEITKRQREYRENNKNTIW